MIKQKILTVLCLSSALCSTQTWALAGETTEASTPAVAMQYDPMSNYSPTSSDMVRHHRKTPAGYYADHPEEYVFPHHYAGQGNMDLQNYQNTWPTVIPVSVLTNEELTTIRAFLFRAVPQQDVRYQAYAPLTQILNEAAANRRLARVTHPINFSASAKGHFWVDRLNGH